MKVIGKTVSLAVMVMCILFLISGNTVSATEENHSKDLGKGLLHAIMKEAGLM